MLWFAGWIWRFVAEWRPFKKAKENKLPLTCSYLSRSGNSKKRRMNHQQSSRRTSRSQAPACSQLTARHMTAVCDPIVRCVCSCAANRGLPPRLSASTCLVRVGRGSVAIWEDEVFALPPQGSDAARKSSMVWVAGAEICCSKRGFDEWWASIGNVRFICYCPKVNGHWLVSALTSIITSFVK